MYIDMSSQDINNNTVISGHKLAEIHRYVKPQLGLCIMSGSQSIDGSRYTMQIIASLPNGQSVVEITENKLFGR